MAFLIGGANSSAADAGYDVENSLRFNAGDSPKLSFDQGTPTSRRIWTYSAWVKRSASGDLQASFFSFGDSDQVDVRFEDSSTNDRILVYISDASSYYVRTSRVCHDPSAWYHIVIASDTTDGTAGDRTRIYVNGVEETSFYVENQPAQNFDYAGLESGDPIMIGARATSDSLHFDGYIAEAHFVDGQQLTPSSFGETDADSGIWKPKDCKADLTYGTNGFYLEFKETGTDQDASGIGADTSGNDNHFAVTNLAATDQATDTPTNNFATLNPLDIGSEATLSEGNCKYTGGTTLGQGQLQMCGGTFGVSKGKWYFEVKKISNWAAVGIYAADHVGANLGYEGVYTSPWDNLMHGCYTNDGSVYSGSANTAYGSRIDDDDIIGVALDLDNGAIYYSDNGTFMDSGDPTSGASKTGAAPNFSTSVDTWILPLIADGSSGFAGMYEFNSGGCPAFTVSSGNSDANGYGNFEYAVPSGYYAPCTKNLAEFG